MPGNATAHGVSHFCTMARLRLFVCSLGGGRLLRLVPDVRFGRPTAALRGRAVPLRPSHRARRRAAPWRRPACDAQSAVRPGRRIRAAWWRVAFGTRCTTLYPRFLSSARMPDNACAVDGWISWNSRMPLRLPASCVITFSSRPLASRVRKSREVDVDREARHVARLQIGDRRRGGPQVGEAEERRHRRPAAPARRR